MDLLLESYIYIIIYIIYSVYIYIWKFNIRIIKHEIVVNGDPSSFVLVANTDWKNGVIQEYLKIRWTIRACIFLIIYIIYYVQFYIWIGNIICLPQLTPHGHRVMHPLALVSLIPVSRAISNWKSIHRVSRQ